jgi:hypothetical protein
MSIRLELSSQEKQASKTPSIQLVGVLFWVHGDRTVAGLCVRCGMIESEFILMSLWQYRGGDFID